MEEIYATVGKLYLELIKEHNRSQELQARINTLEMQLKVFEEKKNREISDK